MNEFNHGYVVLPIISRTTMKTKRLLIPASFLIAVLWGFKLLFLNGEEDHTATRTPKQIKYGFSVQNKTNRLITDEKLWISVPVKQNAYQSLIKITSNDPYKLLTTEQGNQILEFEISEFPPFATWMIHVTADLLYTKNPIKAELKDITPYLLPEAYIESDHPDIRKLAGRLKGKTVYETAFNIYNWVSVNIEYAGHIKNNRGALYALKNKKGDCTEFMSLFIALCRASHIPARGIGGYTCADNCILKSGNYHNWAEFYDNGSWQIADCQKKVFARDHSNYIAMQILPLPDNQTSPMKGYSRFRVRGDSLKVKMK